MKKLIAALAAFFLSFAMCTPSFALDRTQHLTGLNPPSTWLNMQQRDERVGLGTFLWNALAGSSTSYAGQYAGCQAVPVTGLYVAVSPSGAVENCAVYQLLAEEVTGYGGYPSGVGTFLPTDTNQVILQGLVPAGSSTANIGPMGVGSSAGQSIANLIECKVVTSDTTSQLVNIVSSGGAVSSVSANRDRVDRLSCQDKQSSSAVSPTTPTVDTGYVAIAVVLVPNGTATVTMGMITASGGQAFYGLPQLNGTGGVQAAGFISTATASYSSIGSTLALVTAGTGTAGVVTLGNATSSTAYASISNATYLGGASTIALEANATGSSGTVQFGNGSSPTAFGSADNSGLHSNANIFFNTTSPNFTNSATGTAGNLQFGNSATAALYGTVDSGGYHISSDTFGPTSATVTGNIGGGTFTASATTAVIDVANTAGGTNITALNTSGGTTIATITNTAWGLAANGVGSLVSIDGAGDMGINGTYHSVSSRKFKRNITPVTPNWALDLARQTNVVQFCYKRESAKTCGPHGGVLYHLGFIAEDTPAALAGPGHNQVEPVSLAAVALGAAKAVDSNLTAYEASHSASDTSALWVQIRILYGLVGVLFVLLIFKRRQ